MNLYKYHCEPKEARRELYHQGWSLIPRSYTIFCIIFPNLLHRTEEDYEPFLFFISLSLPPCLFFWIGRNKEESNGGERSATIL